MPLLRSVNRLASYRMRPSIARCRSDLPGVTGQLGQPAGDAAAIRVQRLLERHHLEAACRDVPGDPGHPPGPVRPYRPASRCRCRAAPRVTGCGSRHPRPDGPRWRPRTEPGAVRRLDAREDTGSPYCDARSSWRRGPRRWTQRGCSSAPTPAARLCSAWSRWPLVPRRVGPLDAVPVGPRCRSPDISHRVVEADHRVVAAAGLAVLAAVRRRSSRPRAGGRMTGGDRRTARARWQRCLPLDSAPTGSATRAARGTETRAGRLRRRMTRYLELRERGRHHVTTFYLECR